MTTSMKFRVKDEDHSKAIQEKLFSLGVKWCGLYKITQYCDKPFLFADDKFITYGSGPDSDYFDDHEDEEYVLLDGEFVPADSIAAKILSTKIAPNYPDTVVAEDFSPKPADKVNPKQALGQASLPLNLFSPLATAYGSIGKLNGKLKYGLSNFVATPVIASIYADAIRRHLDKWMAGQEFDEADGVPHFAAMLANIDILLCARAAGTLVDDRPLLIGFEEEMEKLTPIVKALQKLHEGKNPHHHLLSEKKDAK